MKHPDVTSLFKYCPIGKNQLSALSQQKMWYSKPAGFNDPFDTRFSVKGEKFAYVQETDSQKLQYVFDKNMSSAIVKKKVSLDGHLDEFRKGIEELGILSLADSNENLLMWSHYAADHKGMCLEFQRRPDSALGDSKSCNPVNYIDSHPTLNTKALIDKTDALASKRRILYSKSKHWRYEQEWRHIVEDGNKLHPWPAPLKAVYFGCKVDESDITLVKNVIADPTIQYFMGYQYSDKFGVKKQGLNVESSLVEKGERLEKLVVLAASAAVRTMQLTLAREGNTTRPASDTFTKEEQDFLEHLQPELEGKTDKQKNPHEKRTLAWSSWIIARLGGWKGYSSERKPGPITMLHGLQRFSSMQQGWLLARRLFQH